MQNEALPEVVSVVQTTPLSIQSSLGFIRYIAMPLEALRSSAKLNCSFAFLRVGCMLIGMGCMLLGASAMASALLGRQPSRLRAL